MFVNDAMLGGNEVQEQIEMTEFTQEAASAWSAIDTELNHRDMVGAPVYKPVAFLTKQLVRGMNYKFLVERTHLTATLSRRLYIITVNEFAGNWTVVSQEQLF
jgi:hypothetical protein